VYRFEGELDCLLGIQAGLAALTSSTGVDTAMESCLEYVPHGSHLVLGHDNDDRGNKAIEKMSKIVAEQRPDIRLCQIVWPEGFKKDVTDFAILCKKEGKDFADALLALKQDVTNTAEKTHRDKLLAELEVSDMRRILPLQAFSDGIAYYTIPVYREKKASLHAVTSEREIIPCTDEAFSEKGFLIERLPATGMKTRWEQKQLVQFLRSESEILPLSDIHNFIIEVLQKYLEFADTRTFHCVSLWIIATYFYRTFHAFPYLHVTGMWGSGKTKALQVLSQLAFNGELLTSTSSPASIVRMVHANGSTCCIDEVEKLWNAKDDYTATMQDILRSGYKRGIYVNKCEPDGGKGKFKVVLYDPYSPKALAGIEGLEQALASRCIQIVMLRTRDVQIANREIDVEASEWSDLRALIYPSALSAFKAVDEARRDLQLTNIIGREAELWRPLLTVAKVMLDEKVFNEVLSLAQETQERRRTEDDDATAPKVLSCIHAMLQGAASSFLTAESIFEALPKHDEEFVWLSDSKAQGRRGKWLNGIVKRLDLWHGASKLRSIHGEKKRGYEIALAKVVEMAGRYGLTLTPIESVTPVTDEKKEPP
jgi:hypothetical protein